MGPMGGAGYSGCRVVGVTGADPRLEGGAEIGNGGGKGMWRGEMTADGVCVRYCGSHIGREKKATEVSRRSCG